MTGSTPGSRTTPRRVALAVLRGVNEGDAYANLTLPPLLTAARARSGFTDRDAHLATELCYSTLRWQGSYDVILSHCARRPIESLDEVVHTILRLGAHQLLGMGVAAHAAVHATVQLCASPEAALPKHGHRVRGLVNAVLRRVAQRSLAEWIAELAPPLQQDRLGHLAFAYAHPRWIVQAYSELLPEEELPSALAANNIPAPVTVALRSGECADSDRETLRQAGATPGRWSPYAWQLAGSDPGQLKPVIQRRAQVQDEGSQLVTLAHASAPVEGSDHRWLDLCAAPGGKSALLARLLTERCAADATNPLLVAHELHPHRAKLLAANLTGSSTAVVVIGDGTRPAFAPGSFDRVLVDAPCSGIGALRRRPEARWRKQENDLEQLVPLQRRLLTVALELVRPGGIVSYVTCSPHRAETTQVVAEAAATVPGVAPLDTRSLLPVALPELGPGPHAQLWPHRHGTDAMFISVLCRSS